MRDVLLGSEVAERFVWSDCVVDRLPVEQVRPQAADRPVKIVDLVKLLSMGPIGALHRAVELG